MLKLSRNFETTEGEFDVKKIYLASALCGALMFSTNATAVDSTGCGLGSMAWKGQSGIGPQVAAISTNTTFLNTLGVTFGTSGCDPNGRITGGTGKMVLAFIENNMEQFAMDASRGQGETLQTLAGIMEVDEKELSEKVQQNFAVLFPNQDVEAVEVTLNLFKVMNA